MTTYNTNLASEFYVLSMFHRLGADTALTLGNKKAVDIIVVKDNKTIITVDVKGLEKRYDWPADNIRLLDDPQHFYLLVCFEGKITNPLSPPSVWVIPSNQLGQFIRHYKTRTVISCAYVRAKGHQFLQAWSLIIGHEQIY
jgi:hypothetical protein